MKKTIFIFLTCLFAFSKFSFAQPLNTDSLFAAEKAKNANQFATLLKEANKIDNKELALWKQVLQAEAYVGLEQYHSALAVLRDIKNWPTPQVSHTSDGYAWLYKRALLAHLKAKRALQKSTVFSSTQLQAYYPLDNQIEAFLSEDEKSLPLLFEQKIAKLERLAFVHAYKYAKNLVTARQIQTSRLKRNQKCEAFYTLGRTLKGFKEHWEDARLSLENVISSNSCSNNLKARSLYYLGSLARAAKNDDLIVKTYTKLHTDYPDHRLADDAVYFLVFHYQNQSSSLYRKYLKKLEAYTKGDMRMVYYFKKGFQAYKKEKFSKASSYFEKISQNKGPINEVYAQGLYWHARALSRQKSNKKQKEAKAIYKKLTQDYPFSFYAILAAKQLGSNVKMPKLPDFAEQTPKSHLEYFALIDQFNEQNEQQAARVVLDLLLIKDPSLKTKEPHLIAKKFMESANYREAIEVAADYFNSGVYGPIEAQKDGLFTAFYPKAFQPEVQKGYDISSLPFGAIEGITREESLFKKDAVSWAGASGLMQLMPGTAQMIQKNVMPYTASTQLTDPLNNILLGSHYLKRMQDRFDGEMPLAIMAYNAGPGNVNKWLRGVKKDHRKKDLDVFIEEIPFYETRGYVKRVMRTMTVYGALYKEDYFQNHMFSFRIETK